MLIDSARKQKHFLCSYPKVDETKRLLERLLLGGLVVVVSLLVELRHVVHHLRHKRHA